MKTKVHSYLFYTTSNEDRLAWETLRAQLADFPYKFEVKVQ